MRKLAPLLVVLGLCACGSSGVQSIVQTLSTTLGTPGSGHRVVLYTSGPNGVKCDITVRVPHIGTHAYCVQRHHGDTVTGVSLEPSGSLHICHGTECGSNIDGPLLAVGERVGVGPWSCTVLHAGVRCTTLKTGQGFLIGANGVQRVGHL